MPCKWPRPVSERRRSRVTYPVNLHDLEALGDVGGVGGKTGTPRHEAHEENALLVVKRLEHLPEPLDELVGLVNLAIPAQDTRGEDGIHVTHSLIHCQCYYDIMAQG